MSLSGASASGSGTGDEAGAAVSAAAEAQAAGKGAGSAGKGAGMPGEVAGTAGERAGGTDPGAPQARVQDCVLWWWSRWRSVVLDVLLAVFASLECAFEGADFAGRVGLPVPLFVALGLVAGWTLLLRRRWPITVVLVSLAVTPAEMGIILGTVGLYTLAALPVPRRITFSLAGLTTLGTFVVTALDMGGERNSDNLLTVVLTALMMSVAMTVAPLLLGLYIGARRRLVESLVDRADGLERELGLLAERATERAQRARIEERTRIAREMHDVVAHRVSLMVVHAGALQSLVARDPERAQRSAELLGDMGRQALDELRQMLGVLRASEASDRAVASAAMASAAARAERLALPVETALADGGPLEGAVRDGVAGAGSGAGSGGAGAGSRGPGVPGPRLDGARDAGGAGGGRGGGRGARDGDAAGEPGGGVEGPALGDVEKLVEQSRAAGITVVLSVEGERRPLAVEAERTAYRVVQEALTNVHKHAPGAEALVRVAYRTDEVAVLVENGPSDGRPSAALPSGGNGLVGMRERVTALGGGFTAGPREGGGFRVSAMLPDRTRPQSAGAMRADG